MSVEYAMENLAANLPEMSASLGEKTRREVALWRHADGTWSAAAGGHYAVALGEWQGDFSADGRTAEEAIFNCAQEINKAAP